jgi:zona occludens toxin (predicted ATPase)
MAEIRVERAPKRRLGWLWLLVVVLLLALAWYLWATGTIGGRTNAAPDSTRTGSGASAAVVTAMLNAGPPRFTPAARRVA